MKKYKKISMILGAFGIIFLTMGLSMWKFGGDILGINFPRTDIVHVGFLLVGIIYIILAILVNVSSNDKKMLIEENDERNQMISSKSGLVAFCIQSLVLSTCLFLLCYMGFMNVVSMLTLIAVNIISFITFSTCYIYLKVKM